MTSTQMPGVDADAGAGGTLGIPAPRRPLPASHWPRSTTGREPQFLLLTLLGDYWLGRTEHIPSAVLVDLLAEFEVPESNARQAIRRLTGRGLLEASKSGRTTFYGIPPQFRDSWLARRARVLRFGTAFTHWDGRWVVVSFSIPERDRDVRRQLRTGLQALKFGNLHDSVWISPHQRADRALALIEELEIPEASVMRAELLPRDSQAASLHTAFGLAEVRREYEEFIERHRPTVERIERDGVTDAEALVLRTNVMSEWLKFRQVDPVLPASLLPEDWPMGAARGIAYRVYDGLAAQAEARFRALIARVDPALADLTSHHTSVDA